jgi:hypothetical protein
VIGMSFIFAIFKSKDLDSLRQKLILLYTLNVTDIIFTIFLVNTGMFVEANAVMASLINNRQTISLIIKIVIPLILLLGIYIRIGKATEKQLYQANLLICGGLICYGLINISHIIWSMLYVIVNTQ